MNSDNLELSKVYKLEKDNNNNILPGNLKRLPDDYFSNTIVFIDAGFLSKLSKYFGGGRYLQYDLIKLCRNISKKQNLICSHIHYYTSPPYQSDNPSKKESERYKKYEKFKNALSNEIISIKEGICQRLKIDEKWIYGQKGVDALLIIDLMSIPLEHKEIKQIILIANDSDFVPAVSKLKSFDVEVILYTYYSKKRQNSFARSNELLQAVSKYVQLTKQDFEDSALEKGGNY